MQQVVEMKKPSYNACVVADMSYLAQSLGIMLNKVGKFTKNSRRAPNCAKTVHKDVANMAEMACMDTFENWGQVLAAT
jgi:hypothetical protein